MVRLNKLAALIAILGLALIALRHPAFSARLRALLDRNSRADYLRALRAQRRRR